MDRWSMTSPEGQQREGRGTRLPGLAAQRMRRALTQRHLAEMAGVAHTTVQQLESLRRGGYPQTIRRLSSALGVEPEELMNDQG